MRTSMLALQCLSWVVAMSCMHNGLAVMHHVVLASRTPSSCLHYLVQYVLPDMRFYSVMHDWLPAFESCCFCPRRFGGAPMQCDLSVLVTLQATSLSLSHTQTSGWSIHKSMANNHKTQLQPAGHELVCLVPEWTSICLCLPGLFKPAFTLILRAFYSADISINTASSCDGPTCFVPKLVAGSASVSLT